MALRRLSYYKKFLYLDMAILLKTNIAYCGLILGIREKDLVFQVNQKIFYRAQGQYNVVDQIINVLDIIKIKPKNILVYRLGREPPVAYLPVRCNILCNDPLQGPSTQSSYLPYFALPEELLKEELPNLNAELHGNNGNSGVQTVDNTDGIVQEICNGSHQEFDRVDQEVEEEVNQEKPNISEIEESTTTTNEFQNSNNPESYDSSCQSVLEPSHFPSTSNGTSLKTSKNNRFGKNPLVEKYESYCKSKLL